MISSIDNSISFKSVNLYGLPRRSKQSKLLLEAIKDPIINGQILGLEKNGIDINLVRDYDSKSRPTSGISIWFDYKKDYPFKKTDSRVGVGFIVNTFEDAKQLIAEAIKNIIMQKRK